MSGYDNGYGEVPPIPVRVVGEGGPGWRQIPLRSEYLAPSSFFTAERVGPRDDPMMIKTGGVITRPSGLYPIGAAALAAGINQGAGAVATPISVISGPPVLDPENRLLVPEHYDSNRELVNTHWSHKPYRSLRLRVVVPSQGPYVAGTATGARVRVRGGAPFGGAIIEREFLLTPSMEACFMAGKYNNFSVDILAMSINTQLFWEWFNDNSGICAETKLWSEVFTLTYGAAFLVPPGAVEAFFAAPLFVGWRSWAGLPGGLRVFDPFATSPAAPAGTEGIQVRGQEMVPLAAVGVPGATTNVQFRLSPI